MNDRKPLSATALLIAKKQSVFRFIFLQILCLFFISLGIIFFTSGLYWYSFVLGALCSIVPSVYMAWRVFGYKGTRPAKDVMRAFYRGEAGKLVLTAVLLSLVFLIIKPLAAGVFFAGFGIAILSHWLSPIVLNK
ncbi:MULTISPECIES: ATP synthase subunit I [Marinomonas]|uniref:ATP synthase subunit I n=1 Tax=Marinomonas TaxID=28253 RepID=UPI001056529F|nr:ATP synthase subunit I [Marinomonas flavescens]